MLRTNRSLPSSRSSARIELDRLDCVRWTRTRRPRRHPDFAVPGQRPPGHRPRASPAIPIPKYSSWTPSGSRHTRSRRRKGPRSTRQARYLIDPRPAAAGFGIPGELAEAADGPAWLALKATRDIAIAILLINGAPRLLGWLMLAVAAIPIGDGVIVLRSVRSGGPKAIAYGIHWTTAAVMLVIAALLIT
ncbi:MAG TPA: DUF4267 domain-containing protein [Solirubrobacteraceae bacterium]|nr:DUF4267 domain-containing protein [Solirubrobacteraceae bacterium]